MPQPTFGSHLASVRKAAGLKEDALAIGLNVSQSTISRLLTDKQKPTLAQVDDLAKLCGVSRWALIGGTELAEEFPSECIVSVDSEAHVKWLAYFASCLTSLSESERTALFAEAAIVRDACEGIRAYLYEPANYTDPVRNQDLPPETVYAIDHAQVSRSHFVVLHARHPSHGAGQELEIATNAGLPVVLLQPAGTRVSRMVLGCYARVHQVHYRDDEELTRNLRAVLPTVVSDLVARHKGEWFGPTLLARQPDDNFAGRLKALRGDMQMDSETLGRHVGMSKEAIENMEKGLFSNPSSTTMKLLAQVLRTSTSQLLDGVPQRLEDHDPIVRRSLDNLHRFATSAHVPHEEVLALWDAFLPEYKKHRQAVADARTQAVTETEWAQRHAALKGKRNGGKQPDLFE
ncbi:MAG: helix-turn-helix domain-containing protein [Polyangiaceae bacterium]